MKSKVVFIVLIWDIYKDRRFKLLIIVGGEVFEHVDSDVHADSRDSQEMALRTADKLLKVKKTTYLYSDNQKTLK